MINNCHFRIKLISKEDSIKVTNCTDRKKKPNPTMKYKTRISKLLIIDY